MKMKRCKSHQIPVAKDTNPIEPDFWKERGRFSKTAIRDKSKFEQPGGEKHGGRTGAGNDAPHPGHDHLGAVEASGGSASPGDAGLTEKGPEPWVMPLDPGKKQIELSLF